MDLHTFDILMLFLLAVALAMAMGIGIVYFVDKKLSDVQINVPACPRPICPKPTCYPSEGNNNNEVVDNTFKDDNNENFQMMATNSALAKNDGVNMDSDYTEIYEDGIPFSNPTNPNGTSIPPMVLTQDSDSKTTKTILLRQGYSSIPPDSQNKGDNITYPSADDVVRYNGDGCFKGQDMRYIRKMEAKDLVTKSCRPYTDLKTKEGSINNKKLKMMTAGSNSANYVVEENINFYVPRLYMGKDPTISGISYAQMNIENPADIDQIGSIPVDDYSGEPVPVSAYVYN